ncbi:MAG: hypothetical protein R3265_07675 [Hyphomonas sp.]|nr:hypothetical protein [Hyphomonas sp.]
MYRFSADKLRSAIQRLAHIVAISDNAHFDGNWSDKIGDAFRTKGTAAMQGVLDGLDSLPVPITQMAIKEILASFDNAETTYDEIRRRTAEINNTLRRELKAVSLISVDQQYAYLLEMDDPGVRSNPTFGLDVERKFPDATDDIVEAGKCLALRRNTACVFHLMRAMEVMIAALATKLNATVRNENGEQLPWGILVSNIKKPIESMPKGPKQDEWLGAHAMLHSVNRAFRTKTAHPANSYTDEQAEIAFQSVKAFSLELADLV